MIKALRYLTLLKWSFITILFMNIFFILSGIGFIIFFGKTTSNAENLSIKLSKQNLAVTKTLSLLEKPNLNNDDAKQLWDAIVVLESEIHLSHNLMQFGLNGLTPEIKQQLTNRLLLLSQKNHSAISQAFLKMTDFKNILIVAVILSLIIGILLPLIIISVFINKLKTVQTSTQETIKNFVHDWKLQFSDASKKRWQSPVIWAQILTILAKSYSAAGNTPVSLFLYELSEIILAELKSPVNEEASDEVASD